MKAFNAKTSTINQRFLLFEIKKNGKYLKKITTLFFFHF